MRFATRRGARPAPLSDVRETLRTIRDPHTDASQISKAIELIPRLREAVVAYAQVQFRDRGRVRSSRDAITIIGIRKLEELVLNHLRQENRHHLRTSSEPNHRIAALQLEAPSPSRRSIAKSGR